jgi:hypothetical protein
MSALARDETSDAERDRIAWNLPRPRPKRALDEVIVLERDRDETVLRESTSDRDETPS